MSKKVKEFLQKSKYTLRGVTVVSLSILTVTLIGVTGLRKIIGDEAYDKLID